MKAQSQLFRYLCYDDRIEFHLLPLFYLRDRIRVQHEYSEEAARYLSHAFAAALLLSSHLKNQEKIKITVQVSGEGEGWLAEANAYGEARGYLFRPETIRKPYDQWLGEGYLSVTRFLEAQGFHPVTSTIQGKMGDIASDLEHFFSLSDQIDSKIVMGSEWAALLRPLPDCPRPSWLEALDILRGWNWDLDPGRQTETSPFHSQLSELTGIRFLDSYRVEFYCPCNKDRFGAYLRSLPAEDRNDMVENGPFPLEIRCHYCNSVYPFTREELDALFCSV